MLILLPPSETKLSGGVGISMDRQAIIWAALDPARDLLIQKLSRELKSKTKAIAALKLGKNPEADLLAMRNLMQAPTMPAIERYTGTLYDALDYQTLSDSAKQRVRTNLFIQSALFGLLPASEQIPYYRFSAGAKVPGVNLAKLWQQAHEAVWPRMIGPILDMRSKSYAALNPIPDRESYFVEVLDAKSGKALNHFNKKAKGAFVRAALENNLESAQQIPEIAKLAGLSARQLGDLIELSVPEGF
ncbi:MAG: peroxide stress protein YaaA [Actinomycetota bacterium]